MADSVKSVTATATLNVSTALKFIPQGSAVSQKERRRAQHASFFLTSQVSLHAVPEKCVISETTIMLRTALRKG
ncbi:hypothetical protein P5673_007501 [Acropora cervicornis]|uniref:Uncharacterized protein n=1 Tax=Acropora cervicornis TaxID=6130 RepID=A0AAD9VBZ1_ACRCE|nr:hypothetical protein P5673_007501 [Acropora cervicornis]